jgi:hypothetical protein
LEKHISTILQTDLLKKPDDHQEMNGTIITRPAIYILSCIKDPSLSNIKKYSQSEYCVQCHSGTIRNFVECKNCFVFWEIIFNFFSSSFTVSQSMLDWKKWKYY